MNSVPVSDVADSTVLTPVGEQSPAPTPTPAAGTATNLQNALDLLCALTPGVQCGVILARAQHAASKPIARDFAANDPRAHPLQVAATWPRRVQAAKELENAAATAWNRNELVIQRQGGNDRRILMAQPLGLPAGSITALGASAIAFTPAEALSDADLANLGRRTAQWLSLLTQPTDPAGLIRAALVLEMLAKLLTQPSTRAAARVCATDLANRLGCERVSIGLLRGKAQNIRLACMVPAASTDKRLPLARAVVGAMHEALDQQCSVMLPQPEPAAQQPMRIVVGHAQLSRESGSTFIASVPFGRNGMPQGVITLERNGQAFDADTVLMIETFAALVGPVFDMKDRLHGSWRLRMQLALRDWLATGTARRRLESRLTWAAAALIAIGVLAIPIDYRVSADARVEGAIERTLAAPVDGFIRKVHALPGDQVKAGEVIVALDEEEATLELHRAEGEIGQAENLYNDAVAKQDQSQVAIQYAKRESAAAQLALARANLSRMRLVAPFDGTLTDGDLSRAIGAPVKRGDVLIKIVPGTDYRVTLKVDERDVAHIASSANGALTLSSRPGQSLPVKVARITPVSSAEQGRNVFEVDARLVNPPADLRPGLEGVARIDAGRESIGWVLSHRVVDWLRVRVWSWWG